MTTGITIHDNIELVFGSDGDIRLVFNGINLLLDRLVGSPNLVLGDLSLDLNNQGGILNVGKADNDWTADVFTHAGTITQHNSAGASNAKSVDTVINVQGVAQTVQTIATLPDQNAGGGLVLVHGVKNDDNGEQFTSLVLLGTNAHAVINDSVTRGTPTARTYSHTASGQLRLAMASDTYDVATKLISLDNPQ